MPERFRGFMRDFRFSFKSAKKIGRHTLNFNRQTGNNNRDENTSSLPGAALLPGFFLF